MRERVAWTTRIKRSRKQDAGVVHGAECRQYPSPCFRASLVSRSRIARRCVLRTRQAPGRTTSRSSNSLVRRAKPAMLPVLGSSRCKYENSALETSMNHTSSWAVLAGCVALLSARESAADSIRCGDQLASSGASLYEVKTVCGDPDAAFHRIESRTVRLAPAWSCNANRCADHLSRWSSKS